MQIINDVAFITVISTHDRTKLGAGPILRHKSI